MRDLLFFLLGFAIFSLSSCQQGDLLYSCDPKIDEWANENLLEIKEMNRGQLLKLKNDSYKRAAYRAFSAENKQRIWKEKYQELKELNWSEAELDHIDLIYSLVLDDENSKLKSSDLENDDELLIFIYRWQEHAQKVLGWNKKQIFAICYSVEKVINKQGDLSARGEQKTMALTRSESGGTGYECSCSQKSSYCDIVDHEGPDFSVCRTPTGGCRIKLNSCGLFWQFNCDGVCSGLYT